MKNATRLVSVVIPAHNAQSFLCDAVNSAFEQEHPDIEVIVVDDGSDRDLAPVVSSYGSRLNLIRCDRGGPAKARNIGIEAAAGEFIQFLDADDLLLPEKVRLCVEHVGDDTIPFTLKKHLAESEWRRARGSTQAATVKEDEQQRLDQAEPLHLPLVYPIGTEGPLHRREVLVSVGGFNEDLWNCEDVELHFRLAVLGLKFDCVPRVGILVLDRRQGVRLRQSPQRNLMGIRATHAMIESLPEDGASDRASRALLGDRLAHYGVKSLLQGHVRQGVGAIKQAHELNRYPRPSRRGIFNVMFRLSSSCWLVGSRAPGERPNHWE